MRITGIHVPMQSQPFVTFVTMCCLVSHAKDYPVKVMMYTCIVEFMNTERNEANWGLMSALLKF